ncbi:MAG: glycerol-3-phosphate acyltransferase [Ignavibacteriales bacterium]
MEYLISALIGYLLGSFPTGYLLVKSSKGSDITKEGSGNVGALNSFEVSKSKLLGISVLFIDLIKGALAVLLPIILFPQVFIYPAVSLIFALFSHCFNPWLKLKGGRGLATAAGGMIVIFPYLLVIWCLIWVIFYVMRKNIHVANIAATIFSIIVIFGTSGLATKYANPVPQNISELLITASIALIIILVRHIDPLIEIISSIKTNRKSAR